MPFELRAALIALSDLIEYFTFKFDLMKAMKKTIAGPYLTVGASVSIAAFPSFALGQFSGSLAMKRLYNPYTGEHFYTGNISGVDVLTSIGWRGEGVGRIAPCTSQAPVFRLYNPYVAGGDHHYTTFEGEKDALVAAGWQDEEIGWYSDDGHAVGGSVSTAPMPILVVTTLRRARKSITALLRLADVTRAREETTRGAD